MTRPPDGGDGPSDDDEGPAPDDDAHPRDRDKPFDEVWKQLPTSEDSASGSGSTKFWDDDARSESLADEDDDDDADEAPASTSQTKLGHPGVAARVPPPAVAAAEMDKLMRGAMPSLPSDKSGIRPSVLAEDDAEASAADAPTQDPPAKPGLRVVADASGDDDDADVDADADASDDVSRDDDEASSSAPARAVAVRPEALAAPDDAAGLTTRGKLLIGTVAAAAIVGLGWAMAGGTAPTKERPNVEAPPAAPIPPTGEPRRPPPSPTPPPLEPTTPPEPAGGSDSSGGGEASPEPPSRSADPRQPPAGTTPEAAEVFERLPVSPADRPPVGGVGATGIHVDRISVGSEYGSQGCSGKTDDFSVAAGDRVSVCVRVVHQREKEEVIVLWQKDGGAARRGKMIIKPSHGYRTRAYLKLREEYVGEWTVRIQSQDDVELAKHSFTVVD